MLNKTFKVKAPQTRGQFSLFKYPDEVKKQISQKIFFSTFMKVKFLLGCATKKNPEKTDAVRWWCRYTYFSFKPLNSKNNILKTVLQKKELNIKKINICVHTDHYFKLLMMVSGHHFLV